MPRAAIYARVSTTRQKDEGYSLDDQIAKCRKHASAQGWDVVAVFRDDHTGLDLEGRPELARLRKMIQARDIDFVLVDVIDRLSREPDHQSFLIVEALLAGVKYEFVGNPRDNSFAGQVMALFEAHQAKGEHEAIKRRTQSGRKARANNGMLLGASKPLFGYVWRAADPSHPKPKTRAALDPCPRLGPVAVRIFEELDSGKSGNSIATLFNREGVPTPNHGGKWTSSKITAIIRNPAYKGEAYSYRTTRNGRIAPESEWVPLPAGTVPALVDPGLWQRANDRIAEFRSAPSMKNKHPEKFFLRGGFVRCGNCGHSLVCRTNSGHYRYVTTIQHRAAHGCQGISISAPVLDRQVWEQVEYVLTHPDYIEQHLKKQAEPDTFKNDIATRDRQILQLSREMANLAESVGQTDNPTARAVLVGHLDKVSEALNRARTERQTLLDLQGERARTQALVDCFAELEVAERWAEVAAFGDEEKRRWLKTLGVTVTVNSARSPEPRVTVDMAFDLWEYLGIDLETHIAREEAAEWPTGPFETPAPNPEFAEALSPRAKEYFGLPTDGTMVDATT